MGNKEPCPAQPDEVIQLRQEQLDDHRESERRLRRLPGAAIQHRQVQLGETVEDGRTRKMPLHLPDDHRESYSPHRGQLDDHRESYSPYMGQLDDHRESYSPYMGQPDEVIQQQIQLDTRKACQAKPYSSARSSWVTYSTGRCSWAQPYSSVRSSWAQERTVAGHFASLIRFDKKTGISLFTIIPEYRMEGTRNGLLACSGRVRVYAKGMPIRITGHFTENGVFAVTEDALPVSTKRNIYSILGYIDGSLDEKTKEAVAEHCCGDLAAFCQDEGNLKTLIPLFGDGGERAAKMAFAGMKAIVDKGTLEENLLRYGIPYETVMRMVKQKVTPDDVAKRPYRMLLKYDVPFAVADAYARRECGIHACSMERFRGFVSAALKLAMKNGHTCLSPEQLMKAVRLTGRGVSPGFPDSLALLHACVAAMQGYCRYEEQGGEAYIYVNHVWEEECCAVQGICRLSRAEKTYPMKVTVQETERATGIRYNEGQREAFSLIRTGGIKVLTGPPGTGKTAVLNGLVHNFLANGNGTIALAATTGTAAKVMQSATGMDAQTAHKMLKIIPYQDTARGKGVNDPLEADLVVVDEMSMMGLQVFSVLAQAVKNGAILLLVGDEDQLMSVEYGNVLHDLTASGAASVCRLTECIRNAGPIFANARKINEGNADLMFSDSFRLRTLEPETFFREALDGYDPKRVQIVCPINNGEISTGALNRMAQEKMNGASPVAARSGKQVFRLGDKVIFHKTDYEKGYINGDMGWITDYSRQGDLEIALPDGKVVARREDYCNLGLAYATTVHKSQGSTFEEVIVVLPDAAKHMMGRRLLYTAVTRAKHKVTVWSENGAFEAAIRNRMEQPRFTCMASRLRESCHKK